MDPLHGADERLTGGLPYLAASATTVYLARQAGLAAAGTIHMLSCGPALRDSPSHAVFTGYTVGLDPGVAITVMDQALNLQVTYGAVMLSFLGARGDKIFQIHSLTVCQALCIGEWNSLGTADIMGMRVSSSEPLPCFGHGRRSRSIRRRRSLHSGSALQASGGLI